MVTYHLSPRLRAYARCENPARCPFGTAHEHLTGAEYEQVASGAVYDRARTAGQIIRFSNDNRFYLTGELEKQRIAPAGVRGLYCGYCGRYIDEQQYQKLQVQDASGQVTCHRCDRTVYAYAPSVDLRASEARLLDDETTRQSSWFHVTHTPDWFQQVNREDPNWGPGLPLVHLGSREAALDRLRDIQRSPSKRGEPHQLFEVRLAPATPIARGLARDVEEDWPGFTGGVSIHDQHWCEAEGVTRYLNIYEAPGTISLLANPRLLQLVTSVEVPPVLSESAPV